MDLNKRNELITEATLEVLQNILPTNILSTIDNTEEESDRDTDDVDEAHLFFQIFTSQTANTPESNAPESMTSAPKPKRKATVPPKRTPAPSKISRRNLNSGIVSDDIETVVSNIDDNDEDELISIGSASSITFFDVFQQQMIAELHIKAEDIQFFRSFLGSLEEIDANWLTDVGVPSIEQLTSIFIYALMSQHDLDGVDESFHLTSGIAKTVTYRVSSIVAIHKEFFFRVPTENDIEHNVGEFCQLSDGSLYEFPNVYGALGTSDIKVTPALPDYNCVSSADDSSITSTIIKLQCTCNANGFLQTCFILVPKEEFEAKHAEVFKQSPLFEVLSNRPFDDNHIVADRSFAKIPFILTPLDGSDDEVQQFNLALDAKRNIIDRTFTALYNRFPILDRIETDDPGTVCNIIESACVLYNVFIANNGGNYHIE